MPRIPDRFKDFPLPIPATTKLEQKLPSWAANGMVANFTDLMKKVTAPPETWLDQGLVNDAGESLSPHPCDNYDTLRRAWEEALEWTQNLDYSLIASLACAISTMGQGAQIWLRLLGNPGTGKSTICEALTVSWRFTHAVSIQRGFHSGWKEGGGDDKDVSLIAKANNKTLITKDGDTLLTSGNRDQTLAEARDIYDRTSRSHYRNNVGRNYSGINMTWLLAGTMSMKKLNKSFLGDRFLDCVVFEDDKSDNAKQMRSKILRRAVSKARERSKRLVDDTADSRQDPALTKAMCLTAGYLDHLRDSLKGIVEDVYASPEMDSRCLDLAELVSIMRARPDKDLEDEVDPEPELATRLCEQMVRISHFVTIVLNKTEVDEEVFDVLRKIAYDTCRGSNYNYLKEIYYAPDKRRSALYFRKRWSKAEDTVRDKLEFLREIGALTKRSLKNNSGAKGRNTHFYYLTPDMSRLCSHIFPDREV